MGQTGNLARSYNSPRLKTGSALITTLFADLTDHKNKSDIHKKVCLEYGLFTCKSQYDFLEIKLTLTGKKSSGWPAMLNSMLPDSLLESMTGNVHCSNDFLLSKWYSPSHSPTTGAPTPDLQITLTMQYLTSWYIMFHNRNEYATLNQMIDFQSDDTGKFIWNWHKSLEWTALQCLSKWFDQWKRMTIY
jgi:hypothetical protein